jgi:hypothetical protein
MLHLFHPFEFTSVSILKSKPRSRSRTPKLCNRSPYPFGVRSLLPSIALCDPATRNPQPATRNPQPATRNPQPCNVCNRASTRVTTTSIVSLALAAIAIGSTPTCSLLGGSTRRITSQPASPYPPPLPLPLLVSLPLRSCPTMPRRLWVTHPPCVVWCYHKHSQPLYIVYT